MSHGYVEKIAIILQSILQNDGMELQNKGDH